MLGSHVVSGRSVEAKSRTVEQAVEEALARLGRSRDEVEVQVLREASRGLLGFGAQDAIVRVKEIVRTQVASDSTLSPVSKSQNIETQPVVQESQEHFSDAQESQEHFSYEDEDDNTTSQVEEVKEAKEVKEAPITSASEENDNFTRHEVPPDELLTMSREVLLDILERMSIIGDVFASWSEPEDEKDDASLSLNIIGDDLGLLIGRGGETLRNLQYLVRLIIVRKIGKWTNVIVDVEGYKQRRENMVRQLARRVANRVTTTSRPVQMDPMNSYERRIVHLELSKIKGIKTKSTGQGEERRVGVYPV
ncbi:MAG: RNA-binding cell elongation regulator Jag/EloR [Ardenticatenaceae bacterium]